MHILNCLLFRFVVPVCECLNCSRSKVMHTWKCQYQLQVADIHVFKATLRNNHWINEDETKCFQTLEVVLHSNMYLVLIYLFIFIPIETALVSRCGNTMWWFLLLCKHRWKSLLALASATMTVEKCFLAAVEIA